STTRCAQMYTVCSRVWFVSYSLLTYGSPASQLLSAEMMREQTSAKPVECSGIGLHTGEHATVRILPAPAGKGIIFRRVDLDDFELRADVGSVGPVGYATTLMN